MEMENLNALVKKIRECCLQEEGIIAAYLFGSSVTERRRAISDIDVAILVEAEFEDNFPFLAFAASLERALKHRIDLILLNRTGELLKYQVRRHGRLIFQKDDRKRKQFEVMGRKLFEDFLFLHKKHVKHLFSEK
jgi:predicted nucleotidyltransferase